MKLTNKRLAKLDEELSKYSFMRDRDIRRKDDIVVIQMSKNLFADLMVMMNPYVIYHSCGDMPQEYKGYFVELVSKPDFVAVAYFNVINRQIHNITEIKEENNGN